MTGSISRASFIERLGATNNVLRSVAMRHAGVLAFFPTERMCRPDCITSIGDEFLFRDGNHLRRNLSTPALEQFVTLLDLRKFLRGLGGQLREPGASEHARGPG